MKRTISLILILILSIGMIAGCQGGTPATTTAKPGATTGPDNRTLEYWNSWSGDSMTWDTWRIGEYTKDTGGKVNVQYVQPDGGLADGKLMAAIASGTAPDLLCTSAYSEIYTYATQDSLESWDDYMDIVGYKESELLPGFQGLASYNGKVYVLPQDSNVIMLYYNTDLFAAAGLTQPPKTMAELDQYAEKLTKKNAAGDYEVLGFIPWYETGGDPYYWMWMFGAEIYNYGTKKLNLVDDKVVNAYKWMNTYAQKYNPEKIKGFTAGFGGMFSPDHPFMTGKVAMVVTGNWYTNAIRIYAPNIKYAVAKVPAPTDGRPGATTLGSNVFVMPKGAKNKDLAAKFYNYIIQTKINSNNFDIWRSIPIKDSMFDEVSWTKSKDPIYLMEREIANNPGSGHPALTSVTAQMSTELGLLRDDVIYNNKDPKPLLQALQDRLQPDIK